MKPFHRYWIATVLTVIVAGTLSVRAEEAETPLSASPLRHAVFCPPFKGEPALASLYHEALVEMLRGLDEIEFLEGARGSARRAPGFAYRIQGEIQATEDGPLSVTVVLWDTARRERIASHSVPASEDPEAVTAWLQTIRNDTRRRAAALPFEGRLHRQRGQNSYTLDRGLLAGVQPGLVLDVAPDDVPLLSPTTGEVIGRESLRRLGRIEIFRVMDDVAYGRPLDGAEFPRQSRLYAREF